MAIDVVVEEVAENLEEIAEATRAINTNAVGYFIGGLCVGVGVGFYFGYRYNREKIKAEAFRQSQIDVEKIREMYEIRQTGSAKRLVTEKPPLKTILDAQGYSNRSEVPRPLPAPVPVEEARSASSPMKDGWNHAREIAQRSPKRPHIIHEDEFRDPENDYVHVSYTYYPEDDVLTAEDDRPLPDAQGIVGKDNLKFGHGADDDDIVFVRNDRLELEMEICRVVGGSFERDVLGLSHDEAS